MKPRGILDSGAIGKVFSLERRRPPADLSAFVDVHWLVSWDLRGRPAYSSQVLPHPCVHVVFEPAGAAVHGISHRRFERPLSGAGWAVGTKFLPGGFAAFTRRPVCELTDRVLTLGEVFGAAGGELERSCPPRLGSGPTLARVQQFLRAQLLEAPDPRRELVGRVVADMLQADPSARVADVAARHHVSERTLQRLVTRLSGWAYGSVRPSAKMRRSSSWRAGARSTGRAWRWSSATTTRPTSRATFARWWVGTPGADDLR